MDDLQNAIYEQVIAPQVLDNGAASSNVVDVSDCKDVLFLVELGAIDVAATVFKVMESDTKTNATTLGGTPTEVVDITDTDTPGASDDNQTWVIRVQCNGQRKRYIQLQLTAGDGTNGIAVSASAIKRPLGEVGSLAADIGADVLINA